MTQQERLVPTSKLRDFGIPYGPTRIRQKVAEGSFPEPIKLSSRRNVWPASVLQGWINQQIAQAA